MVIIVNIHFTNFKDGMVMNHDGPSTCYQPINHSSGLRTGQRVYKGTGVPPSFHVNSSGALLQRCNSGMCSSLEQSRLILGQTPLALISGLSINSNDALSTLLQFFLSAQVDLNVRSMP